MIPLIIACCVLALMAVLLAWVTYRASKRAEACLNAARASARACTAAWNHTEQLARKLDGLRQEQRRESLAVMSAPPSIYPQVRDPYTAGVLRERYGFQAARALHSARAGAGR